MLLFLPHIQHSHRSRRILSEPDTWKAVQKAQLKKILHGMFSMIGTLTSFGTYAMKVPAMRSPAAGDTFAPKFEIHIAHNGSMSDRDARRYGDAIGDAALEKLRVAFSKRGIR